MLRPVEMKKGGMKEESSASGSYNTDFSLGFNFFLILVKHPKSNPSK